MKNKTIYVLKAVDKCEVEFAYKPATNTDRGCIGCLCGDFGSGGNEFRVTWRNEMKELNSVEFRAEFDSFIKYFRFNSETPLLKSRDDMRSICENMESFKMSNTFEDTYLFKIETEEYTYFLRCCSEVGDYIFYIYAYNSEKLWK